jgi:hypothetical protein
VASATDNVRVFSRETATCLADDGGSGFLVSAGLKNRTETKTGPGLVKIMNINKIG